MKTWTRFALVYLFSLTFASATTLTFDDVTPRTTFSSYGGFTWSGFFALNGVTAGPGGDHNGVVSANNVLSDTDGRPASFSRMATFNFNSAYLTAAYNDGLQMEVQGFLHGSVTYDQTYTLNPTGPTLINFNFVDVDQVRFTPSGGTLHPGFLDHGVHDFNFAMDNVSVTVPEPAAGALLGFGALLVGIALHRKPGLSRFSAVQPARAPEIKNRRINQQLHQG